MKNIDAPRPVFQSTYLLIDQDSDSTEKMWRFSECASGTVLSGVCSRFRGHLKKN